MLTKQLAELYLSKIVQALRYPPTNVKHCQEKKKNNWTQLPGSETFLKSKIVQATPTLQPPNAEKQKYPTHGPVKKLQNLR